MDAVVQQLVTFISSVPPSQIFVIYLLGAGWLAIESVGIGLPIEPVLLVLGTIASQGRLDPALGVALAIAATTLGTLLGASVGYTIGRRAGRGVARIGRFVGLSQTRVDHMEVWLRRRGAVGVFLARFVPVLRGLAPYVIGASGDPFLTFVLGTVSGALCYTGIWVGLGFLLGDHYTVALRFFDQFGVLGLALIAGVIALYYALHYLWVRFVWRRLSAHFHRHAAAATPTPATPAR